MSFLTKKHLSRRTILKSMGVTVALPFLDAMTPAGKVYAQTGAAALGAKKLRFVAMEMVHGCAGSTAFGAKKNLWAPEKTGRDFDLSQTSLSALEPFRDDVTIISNTDLRNAEAFTLPEIGGDHFRSSAVFLTQSHPKQTEGNDVYSGLRSISSTRRSTARTRRFRRCSFRSRTSTKAGGCRTATRASTRIRSAGRRRRSRCR
jgi:hypothetical protein